MAPSANLKARLSGKGFNGNSSMDVKNFKDARDKLIFKNRMKIKDARDKIVEKTKVKDARERLNLLHKKNLNTNLNNKVNKAKTFKSSRKVTGTPANTSLTPKHGGVVARRRNIKTSGQSVPVKRPGNQSSFRSIPPKAAARRQPLVKTPPVVERPRRTAPPKKVWLSVPQLASPQRSTRYNLVREATDRYSDPIAGPKNRPLYEDDIYEPLPTEVTRRYKISRSQYLQDDPMYITDDDRSPRRKISHMDYLPREREPYPATGAYTSRYMDALDDDEEMRDFDEPTESFMTRRTFSDPTNYKLVVSNLDHQVTEDELYSLFGSVGDVYDCKILRPGVAELHFIKESDAQAGYDSFHRRTLDNKPMNVKFVDKRVSERNAPPSSRQVLSLGDKRKIYRPTSDQRSRQPRRDIEPDVGTIQHALFREPRPVASSRMMPRRRYL